MDSQNYCYSNECREVSRKWAKSVLYAPNLFIAQPKHGGVGCFELVESMAKLHYKRINVRRSPEKCFLMLKYPGERYEQEQLLFLETPRLIAGHNRFIGTFCVDLTEYLELTQSSAFQRLMDYAAANNKDVMFIFVVCTDDKKQAVNLYNVLNKHMRIDKLFLDFTDVDTYSRYAMSLLGNRGVNAENGVEDIIKEYVNDLKNRKHFAGYDTISRLVDEIVYEMRLTYLTCGELADMKEALIADGADGRGARRIGF